MLLLLCMPPREKRVALVGRERSIADRRARRALRLAKFENVGFEDPGFRRPVLSKIWALKNQRSLASINPKIPPLVLP